MTNIRDKQIHERAMEVAKSYKLSEIELIEILEQVDRYRIYYQHKCNSLFSYATEVLKLSNEVAYIFIGVARKTREVPELKEEIRNGSITVSKAKRMTSVITKENKSEWILLAKTSTKHQLEKQIAIARPTEAVREKLEYSSAPREQIKLIKLEANEKSVSSGKDAIRVQLQIGVSEELMLKLRRIQDLESSKKKKTVSLEESLNVMADLYLEKHDPLKRAKRQKICGKLQGEGNAKAMNFTGRKDVQTEASNFLQDAGASQPTGTQSKTIDNFTRSEKSYSKITSSRYSVENAGSITESQSDGSAEIHDSNKAERNSTVSHNSQGPGIAPEMQASKLRRPLKASVKHSIQLKYNSQCAYTDSKGKRCSQRRHLDVHHVIQVSQGGGDKLENLTLLCSGHHKMIHSQQSLW
ncbi:MAG: HNH endonuclease signature motif containing protein [Pseudobdellovibrionaceae bacterium]